MRSLQLEALEERTLLSASPDAVPVFPALSGTGSPSVVSAPTSAYYSPAQILGEYAVNNIYFGSAAGNGVGQTIAIVDAYNDPNIAGDLTAFDAQYGLPAPPSFTVVSQTGSTTNLPTTDIAGTNPSAANWEFEEALDVEWAHAIAPGASIVLVEAVNSSNSNLYTAVAEAATLGSVVSMSWGASEANFGTSEYKTYDPTYFSASGVTYLAATGDAGNPGTYPAFSPNVVAVGGTNLSLSASSYSAPYTYQPETPWSFSGDGFSQYENTPSYQSADNSNGFRGIPDVVADAGSPVWIYDSFDNTDNTGGWIGAVGTSLSSPLWAGLIAIADQGRVAAGQSTMTGLTQTLPALYTAPSADFHEINGDTWDPVSGLGSPIANALIPALVGLGTAGSATELTVAAQPPSSIAPGAGFGLTVVAEDASGTMDPSYNGPVTISLANNPGGSTLGGTLTATAVNGVATFTNLTLNQAGSGYTLHATASGLSTATTSGFNVVAPAPAVTASGAINLFRDSGAAVAVDAALMVSSSDSSLSGATVTISSGTLQAGDTLNFMSQYGISGSYTGGVLTLSGTATPAQYQTALQSVTFSTTSSNTTTRSISIVAIDGANSSSAAAESVKVGVAVPIVTKSGTSITYTVGTGASAFAIDPGLTVSSSDANLSGAVMTIPSNMLQSGDTLHFTTQNGITGIVSGGVLTLKGTATVAQYQTALRSVTFSTTSTNTTARSVAVMAIDGAAVNGALNSNPAVETVNVSTTSLTLTASGTINTFLIGGSAVAVDAGLTGAPSAADLTGAKMTISSGTRQTGDTLNFTTQNGITGSFASGVLTLSGVATMAQYQTALASVTFSTTSTNTTTRSISTVALDGTLNSSTATESVKVAYPAPVVMPSGTINTFTIGGGAVAVDGGVTVSSTDGSLSGATVTISAGTLQSGDTLHFTNQNGISGAYASGTLTLSGSATPAQYQTALQSVTFSTTSTNTTTRSISIVANDSLASPTTSNAAAESVKVAFAAPVVTPSGTVNTFTVGGSPVAVDAGVTVSSGDATLSGATVTISAGTLKAGDTLNFSNQNGISGAYASGTLTLSGSATPAQYQTALQSVTFSTTSTNTTTRSISIVAMDGAQNSNTGGESVQVAIAAPVVTPSGTINTFTLGGSAVAVDGGVTVSSSDADLTGASVAISAGTLQSGDTLLFTNQNGISGSYASGTLTLSGSATPAQYQMALQSVTFSTTSTNTTTRSVSIIANDGALNSNAGAESVKVAIAPPVVTPSGSINTFTVGGSAVAVDAGLTVSSFDSNLTGATVTISAGTLQSGDTLLFTNQNGISGSYSGGVLTLGGSATPSQYQTALQSVTFSTTSTNTTPRSIAIVALDTGDTGSTPSNTGNETVNVAIAAPVVTANQASVTVTAGAAVVVDSAVTVSSADANLTGATVTIGAGLTANDVLHFTNQNGISGNYSGGVLTLSGSASVANYQAALQSVTFSNMVNNSLATRNISIVVSDSAATPANSNAATTQIAVAAPITVSGAWVENPGWGSSGTTNFFGYLASNGLGSATLGYALKTGASQLTVLPFANINTISVQFSAPVSNIGLGSLALVGGTGGGSTGAATAAPSVTGFTSDGNNTYSWTLSGSLTNNKYVFAIATTGSSFGTPGSTQVTDSRGAGISGTFTTGSSTFSSDGNGLAGSTFDFFFNVLPGNGTQNGIVNSSDTAGAKSLVNVHENAAGYNPYFDYNGAGLINTVDSALDGAYANNKQSAITSPAAPAGSQQAGSIASAGFTALALSVQETGNSQSSNSQAGTAGNVGSISPSAVTNSVTTTSASSGSTGTSATAASSSTAHHEQQDRHPLAAIDRAISDFDLADLWI